MSIFAGLTGGVDLGIVDCVVGITTHFAVLFVVLVEVLFLVLMMMVIWWIIGILVVVHVIFLAQPFYLLPINMLDFILDGVKAIVIVLIEYWWPHLIFLLDSFLDGM